MVHNIPIQLGAPKFPEKNAPRSNIMWDPCATISPHAIIVGSSGTGKTHRLRYMIGEMIRQSPSVTIHILDVHGDIAPRAQNRVVFSEATEYGLNPLEIELDPEFGGVRRRINSFINTLNRSTHKLGVRQEAVLRALLSDIYEHTGYNPRDPRTWDPRTNPHAKSFVLKDRRHPNINDLMELTHWRMAKLMTGGGADAHRALGDLNKELKKFNRLRKKAEDEDLPAIAIARERVKELHAGYIDSIKTGCELDEFLNYDNVDTLRAIYERLKALDAAGVFKDAPPHFSRHDPLRVYDIKALNEGEQTMFAEVFLERLFTQVKARGPVNTPDTFVVIDEAHKFMTKDNEHILNRMSREVRKYGLGLILVSQSFEHFPEDMIANCSMTMILGMHDMHHGPAAKKLAIDPKRLKFIVPQKTAMAQVRLKAGGKGLTNTFHDLYLPRS